MTVPRPVRVLSRTYLRNLALRSTRVFGVAGRAERLGTTLAKLRMMPADFAVALVALRQMRTHTSSDSALLRRVDCVVLVLGRRHTSLPWRTGPMPGVGEEVAFDASGCCPVTAKFKRKQRVSMWPNLVVSSVTDERL